MAALTQEGAKYSDFMSYLQDEFQNNNIQFVINRKFPKDSTDMSMVNCLYSTINVLGTALKQPITRSKMSIFHSRLELGVPDDTENCPPLLFFSYDQNLMTAEKF